MDENREFTLMMAVFSVAAGMVGVCLTGISLLQVAISFRKFSTLADELLAGNAVIFLVCCFVAFLFLRETTGPGRKKLARIADSLFFLGLASMVVACGLVVLALV